jgi:hypothetical protein
VIGSVKDSFDIAKHMREAEERKRQTEKASNEANQKS